MSQSPSVSSGVVPKPPRGVHKGAKPRAKQTSYLRLELDSAVSMLELLHARLLDEHNTFLSLNERLAQLEQQHSSTSGRLHAACMKKWRFCAQGDGLRTWSPLPPSPTPSAAWPSPASSVRLARLHSAEHDACNNCVLQPDPFLLPDPGPFTQGGYSSPESGSPTVLSPCLPSQQGQAQLWSMLPGL